MQLPSLQAVVSVSLPAAEGVTMEATVTLECSSAHEMMVMENVPMNLAETVLPLGSFADMTALERYAEMPVLVFDHPTLGRYSTYTIGCSLEWLLLVSSPRRLQEYQAQASPNPGTPAPRQLLCILPEFASRGTRRRVGLAWRYCTQQ